LNRPDRQALLARLRALSPEKRRLVLQKLGLPPEDPGIQVAGAELPGRRCVVPLQGQGAGRPFFCVHPIGGQIMGYRGLAELIGRGQPFYALQAVGASGDENPLDSIPQMAERYLKEIMLLQPEGPYRLGGWSMGGVVAFEMAHQLSCQGQQAELLALLDSPGAAQRSANGPPVGAEEVDWLLAFAAELGGYAGVELSIPHQHLRGKLPDEQLQQVWLAARTAGALPASVSLESLRVQWRLYRAHRQALLAYLQAPQVKAYPGRVWLYRAEQTYHGPSGLAALARKFAGDPGMGWLERISGELMIEPIPGDHYTILRPPGLQRIAASLRAILNT